MIKNLQVEELERQLNINLNIVDDIENVLVYDNHNSIVLNSNNEIIGLNITGLQKVDFSILSILKQLQYLNLTNNQIRDISFLAELDKLNKLYISGNLISNIDVLVNLTRLQSLKIGYNLLTDIKSIVNLSELIDLELASNEIEEFQNLKYLHNLKQLDLSGNLIEKIDFLKDLQKLVTLNLSNNHISDLTAISNLINLIGLRLEKNSISNITPLRRLSKLRFLNLEQNYVLSEILSLNKLTDLEHLDLSANKIRNIDCLRYLSNLKHLSLDSNLIEDIYPIVSLDTLEYLSLSANEIYEGYPLQHLRNLKHLSLGLNLISNISFLKELKEITHLHIGRNPLIDFSPIKNLKKLTTLFLNDCNLDNIDFLKGLTKISNLNLGLNSIVDFSILNNLKLLTQLDVNSNSISNITFLNNLTGLTKLSLWGNKINEINSIENLLNLNELDLKRNQISDLSIIANLKVLNILDVTSNKITDLSVISDLPKILILSASDNLIENFNLKKINKSLRNLYLTNNLLQSTAFVSKIPNISNLYLSRNNLKDLKGIKNLKNLNHLYVDYNKIENLSEFEFLLEFNDLHINAFDNPCFANSSVILLEKENHYSIIANELKKLEDSQIKAILPEKVVLLGNHASGKSSLLYYLQNRKLDYQEDSTHILKIENYPKKFEKLPKAIIYDFGGQDFYHGIYKAFLTSEAITLLLWHSETNLCNFKLDSKGRPNRNFNVDYWMGQKRHKHLFGETILVQTHADDSVKKSYLNEYSEIEDEFFVSLSNEENERISEKLKMSALRYLKDKLDDVVIKKQNNKNSSGKMSKPYFTFLQYILNSEKTHKCITKEALVKNYKLNDMWRYEEDLRQLHRQGLILVHKENVWLSPVELTKYVHDEILKKEYLNNGIVEKSIFEKNYVPNEIVDLLLSQKVIFLHHYGFTNNKKQQEYIFPNYLPLINNTGADFSLMSFGLENPLFVLKFDKFLPFGLINQMICYFGQLPDQKKFWRDFLIFTIDKKVKIMIKLDLENLEIKVYAEFKKLTPVNFENDVEKYLFYSIMAMYWDFSFLPENIDAFSQSFDKIKNKATKDIDDENQMDSSIDPHILSFYLDSSCRPEDLYISKDDKYFIHYPSLCSTSGKETRIKTFRSNEERKLIEDKERPFHKYQNFTHINLQTMKKIFISYSRKDKKFKDDLKSHLKILERYCVAKAWSCEEMKSGDWDEQIQNELLESDIIIYMVSDNFLASDYIMDKEVNVGIEMVMNNPSKKIICVLVRECSWDNWQFLAENFKVDGLPQTTLGKYQFIPWHIFNKKTDDEREELIALEQWNRSGYEVRSIAYKQISNKILEAIQQIN